jgi:hypothetical protein
MKNLAPIILFAYNRPFHTQETLHYLSQNILAEESTLIVYCDGAKQDASEENKQKIKQVRELVKAQNWPKEIQVIESEANRGLANSIVNGVREVTEKYGKAIVLEDDIITSKYFLKYMNDALNMYEDVEQVLSIGSCNFFAHEQNTPETFFIPIPDCWGWATWKDRWQLFEEDGSKLLAQLQNKNLIDSFNVEGAYDGRLWLTFKINWLFTLSLHKVIILASMLMQHILQRRQKYSIPKHICIKRLKWQKWRCLFCHKCFFK